MLGKSQIHIWFRTIAITVSLLAAGCSVQPVQTVIVNSHNHQCTTNTAPTEQNSTGQLNMDVKWGNLCRVKYHPSHTKNHPTVIEGTLGKAKKYPVVLDTGASVGLFVNDIHIRENNLKTRPLGKKAAGWGTSRVPELNIGETTLLNWPCFYQRRHTELQLFGLPVDKDNSIIVGLPTLQEFKYIALDNIKKEVEFSPKKVFEPEEPDSWAKYSLTIEEFPGGNAYLFVKIPIAGEEIELQFDTGSGKGLSTNKEIWQRIQKKIHNVKLRHAKELYPYIDWLNCEQGTIAKLDVGQRTVKNAKISIYTDDSPLLENCEALLGMQYFQDTVIVLDFERNLIWVEQPRT